MSRSGAVAELKLQLRSYGTLRMHRVVRWLPDTSLAMCVRILANDMTTVHLAIQPIPVQEVNGFLLSSRRMSQYERRLRVGLSHWRRTAAKTVSFVCSKRKSKHRLYHDFSTKPNSENSQTLLS